jgi:hypothetical protein
MPAHSGNIAHNLHLVHGLTPSGLRYNMSHISVLTGMNYYLFSPIKGENKCILPEREVILPDSNYIQKLPCAFLFALRSSNPWQPNKVSIVTMVIMYLTLLVIALVSKLGALV